MHAAVIGVRVADLAVILGLAVACRSSEQRRVVVLKRRAAEVALCLVRSLEVDDDPCKCFIHRLWANLSSLSLWRKTNDSWPQAWADRQPFQKAALHVELRGDFWCCSWVSDSKETEEVHLEVAEEGRRSPPSTPCYGGLVVFLDEIEDKDSGTERD